MVRHWVPDDLQQLLTPIHRSNTEPLQQLHHQPSESLECPRDTNLWIDLDQYTLRCMDVDLQQSSLVKRGVQQRQETLMCNIWTGFRNVPPHSSQNSLMVIAVE